MTDRPLALSRAAVDRAAHRRLDEAWLAAAWADQRTRVLLVDAGTTLVAHDPATPPGVVLLAPEGAPAGERYLLGVDDGGTAYFAVAVDESLERWAPPGDGTEVRATGLREVGARLTDRDAGLIVEAVALEHWHRTHRHCPRCGAVTVVEAAGHLRRCPRDDSEHHPRTDPAVIMLVVDDDDRCLLGRGAGWRPGGFSTLAGFVEPGEALEHAVAREVAEEVGLAVTDVRYVASQPWPFPSSIMLGFTARAVDTGVRVDGQEITEARWFTREQLREAVADGSLSLSPPLSIARRLIEGWYGGPL